MNAIENNWGQQVHFTNLPPPTSLHTYITSLWNILKRKPVFQIQLEFWVNMTLWFWMMYPPPQKSWILSELQLFQSFPTKVAYNDSEQPILPDSQLFQSSPTEVAHNDSEWSISSNLQLFQSFPTKAAQNDLEWPILHGQNKIHSDTREFL